MRNKLAQIINTLDSIEVHGKSNLDMLLGCILALEQLYNYEGNTEAEEVNDEEVEEGAVVDG